MSQTAQAGVIVAWAVAMIVSLIWVARDARKRKQGFAVVALCFFTWPIGIIAWLLLRPKHAAVAKPE